MESVLRQNKSVILSSKYHFTSTTTTIRSNLLLTFSSSDIAKTMLSIYSKSGLKPQSRRNKTFSASRTPNPLVCDSSPEIIKFCKEMAQKRENNDEDCWEEVVFSRVPHFSADISTYFFTLHIRSNGIKDFNRSISINLVYPQEFSTGCCFASYQKTSIWGIVMDSK